MWEWTTAVCGMMMVEGSRTGVSASHAKLQPSYAELSVIERSNSQCACPKCLKMQGELALMKEKACESRWDLELLPDSCVQLPGY